MIWLSLLTVFGVLALVGASLGAYEPDLRLGAGFIIQGRVPWLLLGALWGGVALGAASLLRGRKLPKLGVLALEIVPVAYLTWYVLVGSAFPAHALSVEVGDPFPGYTLEDQDGAVHAVAARGPRPPALYIFYRGHW